MCTKSFLNYLSVIVVFLNVVFKDNNNNKLPKWFREAYKIL